MVSTDLCLCVCVGGGGMEDISYRKKNDFIHHYLFSVWECVKCTKCSIIPSGKFRINFLVKKIQTAHSIEPVIEGKFLCMIIISQIPFVICHQIITRGFISHWQEEWILLLSIVTISVWNSVKKLSVPMPWISNHKHKIEEKSTKVPDPPPKLSALDWWTCRNFQHWSQSALSSSLLCGFYPVCDIFSILSRFYEIYDTFSIELCWDFLHCIYLVVLEYAPGSQRQCFILSVFYLKTNFQRTFLRFSIRYL